MALCQSDRPSQSRSALRQVTKMLAGKTNTRRSGVVLSGCIVVKVVLLARRIAHPIADLGLAISGVRVRSYRASRLARFAVRIAQKRKPPWSGGFLCLSLLWVAFATPETDQLLVAALR